MKRTAWRNRIVKACQAAGTYREFYDDVISALAEILEKRDEAAEEYKRLGSNPLIEYTNRGGLTNLTKNPALVVWDDLNKSALSYWRDLGLTPAGLKKIDESAVKPKKQSALAKVLSELG